MIGHNKSPKKIILFVAGLGALVASVVELAKDPERRSVSEQPAIAPQTVSDELSPESQVPLIAGIAGKNQCFGAQVFWRSGRPAQDLQVRMIWRDHFEDASTDDNGLALSSSSHCPLRLLVAIKGTQYHVILKPECVSANRSVSHLPEPANLTVLLRDASGHAVQGVVTARNLSTFQGAHCDMAMESTNGEATDFGVCEITNLQPTVEDSKSEDQISESGRVLITIESPTSGRTSRRAILKEGNNEVTVEFGAPDLFCRSGVICDAGGIPVQAARISWQCWSGSGRVAIATEEVRSNDKGTFVLEFPGLWRQSPTPPEVLDSTLFIIVAPAQGPLFVRKLRPVEIAQVETPIALQAPIGKSCSVEVDNDSGKPIPGATVEVCAVIEGTTFPLDEYLTDENGHASFCLDEAVEFVITASKDLYYGKCDETGRRCYSYQGRPPLGKLPLTLIEFSPQDR